MGTKKKVLTFLLFAGIMLFAAQSALGGCSVVSTGLDPLISGNAPGTKLEGPITIFYQPLEGFVEGAGPVDMYWFLRLRKGSLFYSFAGSFAGVQELPEPLEPVVLPDDYFTGVPDIIGEFFIDVVVPKLYPNCGTEGNPDCPDIVLKSYDMAVSDDTPGNAGDLFFYIADIVIAVQD